MKRILVMGAGGAPSTNFIRSLRLAKEKIYIAGTDANEYYLMRSEADRNYLVPKVSNPKFIKILNKILKDEKIEFVHAQNDEEVSFLSENRDKINATTFLPSKQTVVDCQNKLISNQKWEKAGIKVPGTILIRNKKDLQNALDKFSGKVWLRNITGAAGKGSLPTTDFKQACAWIDFHSGWGEFTASEMLKPTSVTWMSIWKDGNLIVAQSRRRLYWEMAKVAASGITGVTGGGITVSDKVVDKISQKAILSIDPTPNGLFGVDLTYDKKGVPNPTEINIARFFTTHLFFTKAGLNMPHIFLKEAYNEPTNLKTRMNPLKKGLVWIRGVDFLPILTSETAIQKNIKTLKKSL